MNYIVYIIKSQKDGRFYFGQTNNLQRRLEDHNTGKSSYPKKYLLWDIYTFKEFDSRSEAYKVEKKLKNLKSQKKVIDFIKKNDFDKINQ